MEDLSRAVNQMALIDEKDRRPFKVVDAGREVRLGLTASSLDDLMDRARIKFDISPDALVRVVLEADGTEIDDNDYFTTLEPDTCLMVLWGEDEKWTPYKSILTLGLALEPHSDTAFSNGSSSTPGSPVEELVWRLHQDLSFFPWLTPKELETIAKMDRGELQKVVPDDKFLLFIQELSERYLQDKDRGDGTATNNLLNDPIKLIRMYSKANHYHTNLDQSLRRTN